MVDFSTPCFASHPTGTAHRKAPMSLIGKGRLYLISTEAINTQELATSSITYVPS